jgi:UDPglucose--hexose-1-phosphate uridylyltransferase
LQQAFFMTEFRFEPLTRRWVIAGGDRAARPNEFVDQTNKRGDLTCPFCRGREIETPPAVAEYLAADGSANWSVRVVPNKYPAVNGQQYSATPSGDALLQMQPGEGVHEVIIESPRHVVDLTDLSDDELTNTFLAYRDRLRAAAQRGLAYAQVFKNVGAAAGASIEHSHSQVIGLPWIPSQLSEQLNHCEDHHRRTGRGLLLDLIAAERTKGTRIVAEEAGLIAWFPFASRFPFECWFTNPESPADFRLLTDRQIAELAKFTRDLVRCIRHAGGLSAYNLILHTLPFDTNRYDHYHWHWEILPRTAKQAGFEWATGHFINPVLPEIAAAAVRQTHADCSVGDN